MRSPLPHNPLDAAARKVDDVARRTKSPQFERMAIWTMIASAVMTTTLAAMQAFHMFRREMRDEQRERERERERERRADAASPPPERPGEGSAVAGLPRHDRDGEGRWARREERAAHTGRQHGR